MAVSQCYWHLVVNNGNFTLLLASIGQEWQFHNATDIKWSRMYIHISTGMYYSRMTNSHCYWHLEVMNGNFKLLLTFTVHEWLSNSATDIKW